MKYIYAILLVLFIVGLSAQQFTTNTPNPYFSNEPKIWYSNYTEPLIWCKNISCNKIYIKTDSSLNEYSLIKSEKIYNK